MRPRRFVEPVRPVKQDLINDAIRSANVRLIDEDGSQLGIKSTKDAQEHADSKNLDLVLVAAQADPPVARVMDYSKYRYEQEQKAKLARKHQSQIHVKEIKLRPKIGRHDYETKRGHVVRFLNQRAKVKVTIMFRGRETTHPERGRDLLMRLAEDVAELGAIEQQPLLDGRNMTMVLGPTKNAGHTLGAAGAERPPDGDEPFADGVPTGGGDTPSPVAARTEVEEPVEQTKAVGSEPDAKDQDQQLSQEAVQGDGDGEAPAPSRDAEPQPREEVSEAQA